MVYDRSCGKYLHREVAGIALGRKLAYPECVHHVDHDKRNNDRTNLVICPNNSYHKLLHARQRVQELGGDPNTHKYCTYHTTVEPKCEFSTQRAGYEGLHNMCREGTNLYRKSKGYKTQFNWKSRLDQQYRRIFSKHTSREICKL